MAGLLFLLQAGLPSSSFSSALFFLLQFQSLTYPLRSSLQSLPIVRSFQSIHPSCLCICSHCFLTCDASCCTNYHRRELDSCTSSLCCLDCVIVGIIHLWLQSPSFVNALSFLSYEASAHQQPWPYPCVPIYPSKCYPEASKFDQPDTVYPKS